MVSRRRDNDTSMETILNYDNRDAQSQWSTVWSTTFIPGMDNATGANRFRNAGRRRLRVGSLALSALLTMHSPVPTSAITGGYIVFMMTLSAAVTVLANPMRHFEVYLGQWSISGPGRAFRIVALFDGIGIAMCLNAIFRAINYCAVAAIAAMYVVRSVRDDRLPFTYCRDFDLKPYDPEVKEVRFLAVHGIRILMETEADKANSSTIDLLNKLWSNASKPQSRWQPQIGRSTTIELCKERFPGPYPALYATPAFNYFYVEVVKVRPDLSMHHFNMHLMIIVLGVWIIIWFTMLSERWIYKRLIWNNMPQWIIIIPWIWTILLVFIGLCNMSGDKTIGKAFKFGKKTILDGLSDALEIALYVHAASVGTELITGKGLNRYAAGHIDPLFNRENLWHSFLVVLLTGLHSGGAVLCAAVDSKHPTWTDIDEMRQSSLWIFPVYSKCTSLGNYSHFMSACIFFGLTFSYITVAYVFMKTAVHIIFEYKVKLVFREQVVVGALILPCALLSMLFTTYGGLPLMESVGAVLTGVATPLICLLELVAMLYVYSSRDFTSDMNVAMEDSTCSSRLSIQMQIIPFFALAALISKIVMLVDTELPKNCMILATVPLVCVVIALPLRAVHNTYTYLYPTGAARNG